MNRFITIGIASTLAFASVTAAASAKENNAPSPSHFNRHDDSGDIGGLDDADSSYDAGFYPQSNAVAHPAGVAWDVRHWKGRPFEIMPVEEIDSNGEAAAVEAKAGETKRVARLQAAIEHNRALADRLTAENVNVHNVVGAKAAMDGTMTFYVR
jgi:hypothetical protein